MAAGSAPTPPLPEPDLPARFLEAAGMRESPAALVAEQDTVALQRQLKALGSAPTASRGGATRSTTSSSLPPWRWSAKTSTATPTDRTAACSTPLRSDLTLLD